MAIKYHTVVAGDTLWDIAGKYNTTDDQATATEKLAALNRVELPEFLPIGKKIYLDKQSASEAGAGSGGSQPKQNPTCTDLELGLQSNATNVLFCTWRWGNEETTSEYKCEWLYTTGDLDKDGNPIWFSGSSSSVKVDQANRPTPKVSTFNIPANAQTVMFKVKPVRVEKIKGESWVPNWASAEYSFVAPVDAPPAPNVSINKYKLTAKLENLTIDADSIQFEVYKNDGKSPINDKKNLAIDKFKGVTYVCDVDPGGEYRVRCRAYRKKGKKYSEWSPLSSTAQTIPATPAGFTICRANSTTSVYLEWEGVSAAKKYDIEYTTKLQYFDGSNETTTVSTKDTTTHFEVTGLESGQQYFFRIRAVNDAQPTGESSWSKPESIIIGKAPAAPTTWSSTTTAITGEPLTLYWVHNAQDGSSQTSAQLEITVNGVTTTQTIPNTTNEDEKDKISFYAFDTSPYVEGTKIEWRVKTAGITKAYGDWSIMRTVDIYAPPTIQMVVTNKDGESFETLNSFPIDIYALAGPNTQIPTGYQLVVTANEAYDTVDQIGNATTVNAGDQLYSKHFDTTSALREQLSAGNLDLANGMSYTITCTVSMNSGLTASTSFEFNVSWSEASFIPNAKVTIDTTNFTTIIRPFCDDTQIIPHVVDFDGANYTVTDTSIDYVYGTRVSGALTTTGEMVFYGTTGDGEKVYYCNREISSTVDNVTLAVYRREFDGSFTELASGLNNTDNTNITDPHPALDYARYRIVSTNIDTGAVGFYDLPGLYIGADSVIIQWSEEWTSFNTISDEPTARPPWAGSMLKIPYNIDISDKFTPDVSLVEYIGRKHPVSYYGTQLGATSTWNFEIPADDIETLYALRRLAIWQGDVYVREPSGSGYWANVVPSWDQTHCETTIPVTLEVTRVEGGV